MRTAAVLAISVILVGGCGALAQEIFGPPRPPRPPADAGPITRPADGKKMPHIEVDVKKKQVRVECEAVIPDMALEFFVCAAGTQEHEAVLRSVAKSSHIHAALMMLGLQPGAPIQFNQGMNIRCGLQYRELRMNVQVTERAGNGWVRSGRKRVARLF